MSSSPIPTPRRTSARPATTSTPIYGRGPSKDPQLYDPSDRDKFLIVKRPYSEIRGVPTTPTWSTTCRATPAARRSSLPRNDQTLILLQLHVALQMFHNKLVDHVRKNLVSALFPGLSVFESARRLARWHYQWMVTHDFLPAIVGKAMADSVYKEVLTGLPIINLKYYRTINPLGRPYIPGVLGSRVPLRPRYCPAPIHGSGFRRYPDRRDRCRVERPALRGRADRQHLNGSRRFRHG